MSKLNPAEFLRRLKNENVRVLRAWPGEIVPEYIVDGVPGVKMSPKGAMRKHLYDFDPFFIKDVDPGKVDTYKPIIEEARQEIRIWARFRHERIVINRKVAILFLEALTGPVFIVEEKVEAVDHARWEAEGLLQPAEELCRLASIEIRKGGHEFTLQNLGYSRRERTFKFFDVFPCQE